MTAKKFSDLHFSSTKPPTTTLSKEYVEHFLMELEAMDSSGSFDWASETVQGIHDTVSESGQVTRGQLQAINNIRAKRADSWPEIESE